MNLSFIRLCPGLEREKVEKHWSNTFILTVVFGNRLTAQVHIMIIADQTKMDIFSSFFTLGARSHTHTHTHTHTVPYFELVFSEIVFLKVSYIFVNLRQGDMGVVFFLNVT